MIYSDFPDTIGAESGCRHGVDISVYRLCTATCQLMCKVTCKVERKMAPKMARAPVYLVVAQVKFNRINALSTYLSKIQDDFRKCNYPDQQTTALNVLNLQVWGAPPTMGGPLPGFETTYRHTFLTIDRTEGFVLAEDGLTYLTAEQYEN